MLGAIAAVLCPDLSTDVVYIALDPRTRWQTFCTLLIEEGRTRWGDIGIVGTPEDVG